jgi:cation transport regulator ChaB
VPLDKEDLPGTLERSPAKAQRTYAKALESAEEQYGPGERAQRTAYAALKHAYERRGDRWQRKKRKGPSDPQAKKSGREARERPSKTFGGVDVLGNTKQDLYERAKELGVPGRSRMSKEELGEAIARRQ